MTRQLLRALHDLDKLDDVVVGVDDPEVEANGLQNHFLVQEDPFPLLLSLLALSIPVCRVGMSKNIRGDHDVLELLDRILDLG